MKHVLIALSALFFVGLSTDLSAYAEGFTLTRGDGKVFSCSDDGEKPNRPPGRGGNGPTKAVTQCGCVAYGSNYGEVYSTKGYDALKAQCRAMTGYDVAEVKDCKSIMLYEGQNLSCKCTAYGSIYEGEVLATYDDVDELKKRCVALTRYNVAQVTSCKPI